MYEMQRLWSKGLFVLLSAHLASIHCATGDEDTGPAFPPGDVRNCPTTSPIFPKEPLFRMEVLPGAGFDSLRSLDMGQVHAYNYSKCRVSNDGRYLLPDNIFLIPTMKSHVQVFAEFIDHWENYTSTTSTTISLEAGFESIVSGKFSDEYLSVKSHQYNDKSLTTRVQIRNLLFKVKIQPDSQLHPTFKSRLFEIAANIQNNNTEFAHYLAELTVREYGTHFVTSMDAGAVLSQVDHIKSSVFQNSQMTKNTATASASANFFGKISFGATFSHSSSTSDVQGFVDNRTYSEVYSWGGPPFGPNLTVTEWENGVPNSMVAIDRSGDPLHYAITPTTLPEIPESTVFEVANMVFRAISRYYKVNTRYGCTDLSSPNFDFQANADDNSCKPPSTNFSFGGIYQTCEYASYQYEDLCNAGPQPMKQDNPLTGDTTCPDQYWSVLLHSGQYKHTIHNLVCHKHCSWFHCHDNCALQPFTSVVNYNAYWCVDPGQVKQNSGYLFGGYYTSTTANPFTGTKSCPRYYVPLHFGEDMHICVSDDYELGTTSSIPFAGFESCIKGNPLAATNPSQSNENSWPHACPVGFSQHLVTVDENCEINFCVKSGAFNQQRTLPPRLPPFRKRKQMNPNATDTLIVVGNSDIWFKTESGEWIRDSNGDIQTGRELMIAMVPAEPAPLEKTSSTSSSNSLSSGAVAGISIAATIALCTLIVVVVFAGFSIVKKRRSGKKGDDPYLRINEENTAIVNPQESNI